MPVISTLGAMSSRGFGEFTQQEPPVYVEDVFGTYLYSGNSSSGGSQTITNNINISGKGGLVWIKARNQSANHILTDTARGAGTSPGASNALSTNLQSVESLGLSYCDYVSAFNTTGFTVTQSNGGGLATTAEKDANTSGFDYAAFTFRKQKKFFDIVTYTGNGSARTISHNLGSVPGMIIVKARSEASDWICYHVSVGNASAWALNAAAGSFSSTAWNNTTPTSTVFSLGANNTVNRNGTTYVAYLFANSAGGFGLTGTDSVVSCGSFVPSVTPISVNLGWEPQFVLFQNITAPGGSPLMFDNMRGLYAASADNSNRLTVSSNGNESNSFNYITINANGFIINPGITTGATYIYLAIRRGPMKVPTSGTSVFSPNTRIGTGTAVTYSAPNFAPDTLFSRARTSGQSWASFDRLRGGYPLIIPANSAEDTTVTNAVTAYTNTGFQFGIDNSGSISGYVNGNSFSYIYDTFARAPGFMDVVCYSGTGTTTQNVTHNLGVQPELIIYKTRSNTADWIVHTPSLISQGKFLFLNRSDAAADNSTQGYTNSGTPTSTLIRPGMTQLNMSGWTYVAYLFATCAGVSKVGTYTGNNATQTINCGFTGGARYVMIKRTDSTGNWWVWDTARGMAAGTDPRLPYNSTAGETNANWVYTTTGGFEIVTADASINAGSSTYIYLAIA